MAEIGQFNQLEIVKEVDFGVYLDGGDLGEILLPTKFLPQQYEVGEKLDVFLYLDSEDQLIATTQTPFAKVGDFTSLKVIELTAYGAFLDWGLDKDLLVPFNQQQKPMQQGRSYLVYLYVDPQSQRIAASSKLDRFLDKKQLRFKSDQEVDIIVAQRTDLGFKAIVDNTHWGVIYQNEVFKPLRVGDKIKGFVKRVREDQRIDLALQRASHEQVDELAEKVLTHLQQRDGFSPINDKSSPQAIASAFGVSKKVFKRTIGGLYKQGLIDIQADGIKLK